MSKEKKTSIIEKSARENTIELLCADCYDIYSNTSSENAEKMICKDCIIKLVAENKKTAEKYIKEGSVGMLIFGFFWGWIKAFLYMFIALFKGANDGGGSNFYGGLFRFFRAIIDVIIFPILYTIRVNTTVKKKKQAEEIIESNAQTLKEVLGNDEKLDKEELRKKMDQIVANSEELMSFDKQKSKK